MDNIYKYTSIAIYSLCSYFFPIKMLFVLVLICLFFDFVTGVIKSKIKSKNDGEKFIFSAHKMAKTITKFAVYATAIFVSFMIDKEIVSFIALNAANYVCLFIVLVEIWSIIENCVFIFPDNKFFNLFKSVVKTQLKKHADIDIDALKVEKPKYVRKPKKTL